MKFHGKAINKPAPRPCVIPREGGNIVFMCKPVEDYTVFDELCKQPVESVFKTPQGKIVPQANSDFEKRENEYYLKKFYFVLYHSINGDGIEFEKVEADKPETWVNVTTELEESGFSALEINEIHKTVNTVNGLNNEIIQEATDSFLASQLVVPEVMQ